MLVRFLQDYQGYLTPGHFYRFGQEVDMEDPQALLDAGRVELVVVDDDIELDSPTWMNITEVPKRKAGRPKKAQ